MVMNLFRSNIQTFPCSYCPRFGTAFRRFFPVKQYLRVQGNMVAIDFACPGVGQGLTCTDVGQTVAVDQAPVVNMLFGCEVRLFSANNFTCNLVIYIAGIEFERMACL
ncbi:Uncharacterised protein [Neisseria meningitidis]|nr:Uncharacterised protein [Neisseria meningitidis]